MEYFKVVFGTLFVLTLGVAFIAFIMLPMYWSDVVVPFYRRWKRKRYLVKMGYLEKSHTEAMYQHVDRATAELEKRRINELFRALEGRKEEWK